MRTAVRARLRPWALWTAGFLSFPIAGGALAGPVDDPLHGLRNRGSA